MKYKISFQYSHIKECNSFWSWLFHEWRFYTTRGPESLRYGLNLPDYVNGYHESGVRIFGLSLSWVCLAAHVYDWR